MRIPSLLLALLTLQSGCGQSPASRPAAPMRTRLSLTDATGAVRADVYRENPEMNPSAEFPLKEITPPEVWDRLHVQLFRVTRGVQEDQAYLIDGPSVFPLGNGFGGWGVMSACVADLNADGKPELAFTYSWGSGIHRSVVGVWTGGRAWIDARPVFREGDLSLRKIDDRHIEVDYGEFDISTGGFKSDGVLGDLTLAGDRAHRLAKIQLRSSLPPATTQRIWK